MRRVGPSKACSLPSKARNEEKKKKEEGGKEIDRLSRLAIANSEKRERKGVREVAKFAHNFERK